MQPSKPNETSRRASGASDVYVRMFGSPYPQELGVVGSDEHPITVVELPRVGQYVLTCGCGWSEIAVTVNHARMLTHRHAPDQQTS